MRMVHLMDSLTKECDIFAIMHDSQLDSNLQGKTTSMPQWILPLKKSLGKCKYSLTRQKRIQK